jgi:dTDP-4-dehydrorhamnose reductase
MLGHKLCQVLSETFEVWGTVRESNPALDRSVLPVHRVISGVDAADEDYIEEVFGTVRPEVVINAIGVVKQISAGNDPVSSIIVNSLFPHRVAKACRSAGARLIHISTDCVFSGTRGHYNEGDPPDPGDLYGRTKLLGEVTGPNVLTVRTSIVGRELRTSHGLVEWFLSSRGKSVKGYSRAVFSGLPTLELARALRYVIDEHPALAGLYHIAASPIDKYRLLLLLRDAYGIEITIEPYEGYVLDRSLDGSRFREVTGFVAEPWGVLVRRMASDPTPYDRLRAERN